MRLKSKKVGVGLEIKSFVGRDCRSYIVFRTGRGSFHVFAEVEAKEAARQCGATSEGNTRTMWEAIWRAN